MMPCFADNLVDVHTYVVALSLKFLVKCIVWTGMEEVHCCFGKRLNERPGEIGF
jgi:hypothetical protein